MTPPAYDPIQTLNAIKKEYDPNKDFHKETASMYSKGMNAAMSILNGDTTGLKESDILNKFAEVKVAFNGEVGQGNPGNAQAKRLAYSEAKTWLTRYAQNNNQEFEDVINDMQINGMETMMAIYLVQYRMREKDSIYDAGSRQIIGGLDSAQKGEFIDYIANEFGRDTIDVTKNLDKIVIGLGRDAYKHTKRII